MAGKMWWLEQLRPWWWEPLVCGSVNFQCGFIHMLEAQEKETGPERAPRYPALPAMPPILKVQQPTPPQRAQPVRPKVQTQQPMGNIRLKLSCLLLYVVKYTSPVYCLWFIVALFYSNRVSPHSTSQLGTCYVAQVDLKQILLPQPPINHSARTSFS